MILYVDIDGTICREIILENGSKDYENHVPIPERIQYINSLYDKGHEIHYWTARGIKSGIDRRPLTEKQLKEWGCKYHGLHVGNKPHFDVYVCDKSFNSEAWFAHEKLNQNI